MRRMLIPATASAGLLLGLSGCAGADASMPDVAGSRLDVALSDIERAGHDPDDVEIVGGGALGVIDEGNWTVCEQEPASGTVIAAKPRLIVDRDCEGDEEPAEPVEPSSEESSPEPAEDATPEADAQPAETPSGPAEDMFRMPALVGANLQEAQDELQSLGSFLLTQTDATGAERFQVLDANWKVCFQNPKPGTRTSTFELVELGAVKLEETCP